MDTSRESSAPITRAVQRRISGLRAMLLQTPCSRRSNICRLPLALRSPARHRCGCGAAAAGGVTWYLLRKPRPTAKSSNAPRRDHLASSGRITDGSITETPMVTADQWQHRRDTHHAAVDRLQLPHRRCGLRGAQDVTTLAEHVHDVRTDLPIQVRYEPHNPANSIVVAENWSGLRLSADVLRAPAGHRPS